ncbi:MAG: hypothetical protein ACKVOY_13725, partial [Burkholderiaceae bacterium]
GLMKITYMLVNRSGKGRRIPAGDAWQWIHHAEDVSQLKAVFLKLKKRIRDDRLTLANLHFEKLDSSGVFMEMAIFEYKGHVIDDETISPKRIIFVHEESVDEPLEETT